MALCARAPVISCVAIAPDCEQRKLSSARPRDGKLTRTHRNWTTQHLSAMVERCPLSAAALTHPYEKCALLGATIRDRPNGIPWPVPQVGAAEVSCTTQSGLRSRPPPRGLRSPACLALERETAGRHGLRIRLFPTPGQAPPLRPRRQTYVRSLCRCAHHIAWDGPGASGRRLVVAIRNRKALRLKDT